MQKRDDEGGLSTVAIRYASTLFQVHSIVRNAADYEKL